MARDIFGEDVLLDYMRHDTTTRPRDGIFTGLAKPWERTGFMAHYQDNPGHLCSRVCSRHGDLARWADVQLSEVPA